ncbi:hypothetical protein ACJ6WF_22105 [Streptomyces sp. MMS24-I2-30]|uniref:hypothetical protein n=1 Tax=Streptomyces sp. MMS24-I2-30 TaxID=3351564 RepID=UPI003896B733
MEQAQVMNLGLFAVCGSPQWHITVGERAAEACMADSGDLWDGFDQRVAAFDREAAGIAADSAEEERQRVCRRSLNLDPFGVGDF